MDSFNDALDIISTLKKETLISRTEWGRINFKAGAKDFDRIFSIISYLNDLPVDLLPGSNIAEITVQLTSTYQTLQEINEFNIEVGTPSDDKNILLDQLSTEADSLYSLTSPWIPFLAYHKGDVAENLNKLTAAIAEANKKNVEATTYATERKKEVDKIVTAAREAAAAAGAAVFTKQFETAGDDAKKDSKPWIIASSLFGAITILVATLIWFNPEAGLDTGQLWQKTTTKIVVLGLLISATFWCGKIYKALMHQSVINKHRALSIQTLQAFVNAAEDTAIKDAVVIEAARSVFGNSSTGYIDENKTSDGDIKIFEVAKNILPQNGG